MNKGRVGRVEGDFSQSNKVKENINPIFISASRFF